MGTIPVTIKQVLFLFLVLSLFFVPHWLRGGVYGTFDLSSITIPLEDIFARYQKQGMVPVWTPEIQAGYPLIANAIQSFFYVPHVLLRQFFSGLWVANISLLLHIYLAAVGMLLLLRSLGFRRITAITGAFIFAGGGYFIGRITLPHLFFPAAWIPFILWAQIRALERPKIKHSVLFAALIAAQIFSGHIQMFVYTTIIMSVITVVYLIKKQCFPLQARWHVLLVPIVVGMLTAVTIMPTVELLPQSKRTGPLTGAELLDVSYPPSQLLTFIMPRIYGFQDTYKGAKNEPELMEYVGWFGLIAGIIGIFTRKTWQHPIGVSALALVVLGFLLAGGNYSPFFHWVIDHVSFWAQFANPGRALILVHVGWIVLIAFGMERFPIRKRYEYLIIAFVATELLFWGYGANRVTMLSAWQGAPHTLADVPARDDAPRIFSNGKILPHVETDFSPLVGPSLDQGLRFEQAIVPQQDNWQGGMLGLTWNGNANPDESVQLRIADESGTIIREVIINGARITNGEKVPFSFFPIDHSSGHTFTVSLSSTIPRKVAPHMIIFANIGGFDYNPTGFLSVCAEKECKPVTSAEWNANADLDLQLLYTQKTILPSRELLLPLLGESTGQQMVRGHLTLQIGRMYRYMRTLGEQGSFVDSQLISRRGMLDRLSVGTLIGLYPEHRFMEGMDGVTLVNKFPVSDTYVHVYKNSDAFPRVQLFSSVRRVANEQEALSLLASSSVSPKEIVIERLPEHSSLVRDTNAALHIQRDDSRKIEIMVDTAGQQVLVVRDAMYTGWHAFLDEREVPIYSVDSVFRGVVVPAGKHMVRFKYIPRIYNYSAAVSLISWVMAISFLVWQDRNGLMQQMKSKKNLVRIS